MSLETAKKALNFFRKGAYDQDKIQIGMYGGEPLLEFDLIRQIVEYAENIFAGKEISFFITTNATLLNEEKIKFILAHNFYTSISLDGPKQIQDKNRVYASGQGTYDEVLANLRLFYEMDPQKLSKCSLSMVLNTDVSYETLSQLLSEPVLANVKFRTAPVEIDGIPQQLSDDYIRSFQYQLFLYLIGLYRGNEAIADKFTADNAQYLKEESSKFVRNILPPVTSHGGPCIPGKTRLFVDYSGNFYPCEKVNEGSCMQIGNLNTGFNMAAVKEILNVGKLTQDDCKQCWALPLCQLCINRAENGNGPSASQKRKNCESSKDGAYNSIMQKILEFEEQEHLKNIFCKKRLFYENNWHGSLH